LTAQLLPALVLHLVLGLALTTLVWGCGLGLARAAGLDSVFAFPFGLALVLAAAALVLYSPWLGALSLALLVSAPALSLHRRVRLPPEVSRALAWGSPAAVGLALALGSYYHGPGRTYDSWAGGDVAFYAGRIAAVKHSLFPFPDLAAAGHRFTYAEVGPSLVGGALTWFPSFDPFLFGATTLPLVGMMSVLVGFALLERPVQPRWTDVLVVTTLAVSMTSYGSWLVESSPVALAVPLVFPMYALYRRTVTLPMLVSGTALLAFLCVCLKVLMLLPLAVLVGAAVLRDHRRALSGRRGALLVGGLVVVAAAVVATLFATAGSFGELVHLRVSTWERIRDVRDVTRTSYAPGGPAVFLAGLLVLSAALARERRYALVLAVALPTLLMQFVDGINFEIAVDAAVFAAALDLWARPARRAGWLVAAGVLLSAAVVARDIAPLRTGAVFALLIAAVVASGLAAAVHSTRLYGAAMFALGTGLVFAFAGRGVLAFVAPFAIAGAIVAAQSLGRGARTAAALGVAVIAFAALGATAVAAHRENFRLRARTTATGVRPPLTREDWEAWRWVRRSTPRRSLLFTSLTGHVLQDAGTSTGAKTADAANGWNYYPMIGRRQLYIAGWVNGDYRDDAEGLTERLGSNDAVLAGSVRPCDVPEAGSYAPYYVVLERSQRPPPRSRLLHQNAALAVYRLAGCGL
jgi:hypothetical protein